MTGSDDPTRPPSLVVVEAVAAAEDARPEDLNCTLADVVTPEALDRLLDPPTGDAVESVTFEYCGYTVTVDGDGGVNLG